MYTLYTQKHNTVYVKFNATTEIENFNEEKCDKKIHMKREMALNIHIYIQCISV